MSKRALENDNDGEKRRKVIAIDVDWTQLPLEITAHILSFDDDVHRPMVGLTCKAFRDASLVYTNDAKMKCHDAARYGWLSALIWLRENGCPWYEYTCAMAARGGHLEVLQWAREHGCPWGEGACREAARG